MKTHPGPSNSQRLPPGLSWNEAAGLLTTHGPNVAVPHALPPWWRVLAHSFNNPFNYILLVLGIVSWLTDDHTATAVMSIMIITATLLRFWQEFRSLVRAESLRRMVRNRCSVWRTGPQSDQKRPLDPLDPNFFEVLMEELVPGDLIRLSAGDMVPADVRLIDTRDLFVSQSALTGEAMPVEKTALPTQPANGPHTHATLDPDTTIRRARAAAMLGDLDHSAPQELYQKETASRSGKVQGPMIAADGAHPIAAFGFDAPDLCYMGSSIVSGTAVARVLHTGPHTQMGKMGSRLTQERPQTSFDRGVNRVSWLLIKFMFVMVPIVFFINGMLKGDWLDAFFFSIAVAVGLTPEMLPMIVNANLARGAVELSRHKVVVKQMSAIQNLGAMSVLCTDKTGTLTQDKVVLIKHLNPQGRESQSVLEHAYLNSYFQTSLRNLIDRAVIDRAQQHPDIRSIIRSYTRIDELPFDFSRRRMSVVLQPVSGGPNLLICKGAVDELLDVCTRLEQNGEIHPLTADTRTRLIQLRDDYNEDGLRLLGVAYRAVDKNAGDFNLSDESQLIFSGFIALLDPPKETAGEAIRLLAEHHVQVKILTGDNSLVARKVCRDVGLSVTDILTGAELEPLDDDTLQHRVENTTIFAKLNPSQKARVVAALKKNGHTVGFMGDGINDALALRESDVGISVDSGVDLAKEAADIILLEKSLLVLENGILEGRRTFGNIIKYIKMTASSNFGNVFSVLVAAAFLPFLPMLAIHLLIQNLLYDISQISIPWDRMDAEWLRKPRQWSAHSLQRFMTRIGPISSIFDITTFLGLWYLFAANTPDQQSLFHSGWFVEGLISQTLIIHMIRTEKIPFLQSRAAAPVLLLTALIIGIGCLIPDSPLGSAIGLQALPALYWPFLIVTLLSYCLLIQWVKHLYIRKYGEWL